MLTKRAVSDRSDFTLCKENKKYDSKKNFVRNIILKLHASALLQEKILTTPESSTFTLIRISREKSLNFTTLPIVRESHENVQDQGCHYSLSLKTLTKYFRGQWPLDMWQYDQLKIFTNMHGVENFSTDHLTSHTATPLLSCKDVFLFHLFFVFASLLFYSYNFFSSFLHKNAVSWSVKN